VDTVIGTWCLCFQYSPNSLPSNNLDPVLLTG
jgi:hypothetical protein